MSSYMCIKFRLHNFQNNFLPITVVDNNDDVTCHVEVNDEDDYFLR